jgi:SH3-like domain-containing protein
MGSVLLAAACLAVTGAVAWPLMGRHSDSLAKAAPGAGDTTASIDTAERRIGPSGLALPRFVSLKAEKVNVRRGPSSDHAVAWVFKRKGLPVEIVAEFENWRRIRDSDGEEGWILQNMLSGKRTAIVSPWRLHQTMPMLAETGGGSVIAKISTGVVGDVDTCTGEWCRVSAGGYEGWIEQAMLWGVYPGESVD